MKDTVLRWKHSKNLQQDTSLVAYAANSTM
jgi:hypothetical protein